jgi:hypothetical protein
MMNIKITRKWLEERGACQDGKEWCLSHGELTLKELYPIFLKHGKYEWLSWLMVRLMTKKQKVQFAIYAAELVIGIYEKHNKENKAPRKAIDAAKAYLKRPCKKTKDAAYDAALAAYDATALAAAYATALAAAYAADADAADAAALAAYDAAALAAAYAADAYDAARTETYKAILEYGYNLLLKKSN